MRVIGYQKLADALNERTGSEVYTAAMMRGFRERKMIPCRQLGYRTLEFDVNRVERELARFDEPAVGEMVEARA